MTRKSADADAVPLDHNLRIGVDLGGTKTEVAVLNAAGGFLLRRRIATPRHEYPATVAAIVQLVVDAEAAVHRRCTVGIGIPGAISPASGRIKNANSSWLNGQSLQEDLETALGRPVRIQNDANCLAMSEAADGAAAGARCVLGLILGTGVGAGICIGGQVLTGRNAIAGEWGHNPLPHQQDCERVSEPVCWCGRRGCIETWLSGPALARDFALCESRTDHRATALAARALDAQGVFAQAEDGEAVATRAVDRWLDRLARSLATVLNVLDPDVVVIGGGLSNAAIIYRELPRRLGPFVFSDRIDTAILPAAHGDSSGVRGAARLW
jgi:fructokinase